MAEFCGCKSKMSLFALALKTKIYVTVSHLFLIWYLVVALAL